MKAINIGFGNVVFSNRVVGVFNPDSAPMKRLVAETRRCDNGVYRLIDATQGRRTRAVIVTDDGHLVLSSIQPETIAARVE